MSSGYVIELCAPLFGELEKKTQHLETLEICIFAIRNITDPSIWNIMGGGKFNPKNK